MASSNRLVCALDFGTSCSGYAYSNSTNLDKIEINEWGDRQGFKSYKTATSVLVDPNGDFEAFGFDAEEKYAELISKNKTDPIYLYKNFKMMLHDQKHISNTTEVHSTWKTIDEKKERKSRPAMDIFVMAIGHLKDTFITDFNKMHNRDPSPGEVLWVLTVPAIWNDKSKRFMREAACEAGVIDHIDSSDLILALEPEAAALYCKALHTKDFKSSYLMGENYNIFQEGTKYLIVDAGGGTVDITGQEILPGGKIKEIMAPSGGHWGGNQINLAFEQLLADHFDRDCINSFKEENPKGWFKLEMEFEKKKRATIPNGKCNIRLENVGIFKKYMKKVKQKALAEILEDTVAGLSYDDEEEELVISATAVLDLYHLNTGYIIEHLEKILTREKQLKEVCYILLVGGFAMSEFLFRAIDTNFGNKYIVLLPPRPATAVLKGAVLFGLEPDVITTRIARKTYGYLIRKPFEQGTHDSTKLKIDEYGSKYCDNIFRKMITKGEEIGIGDIKEFSSTPFDSKATHITRRFFCTERKKVMYVDEDHVEKLAEFKLNMPDATLGKDRKIKTTVVFSGTEMQITAKDETTGQKVQTEIKFS